MVEVRRGAALGDQGAAPAGTGGLPRCVHELVPRPGLQADPGRRGPERESDLKKSESDEPYKLAGEAIRAARKGQGLTLEGLEAASGVPASFIGQIERRVKKGSLTSLARIAKGLNMPLHELLRDGRPAQQRKTELAVDAILRGHTEAERTLLLSTLTHISRRLRALRRSARAR